MGFLTELKRRNVLRVAAAYAAISWLLIQIAETTFPAFGLGDGAVRLIIVLVAAGLLPAVAVAWAFEWTPDGLMLDAEADRAPRATRRMAKRLDRIVIVVLAAALGFFVFDRYVLVPQRQSKPAERPAEESPEADAPAGGPESVAYGRTSIAVLPFLDLSPVGDQGYLADGFAEGLLNQLARIPELRVISRSSAFSFKGRNMKSADIARELNVTHMLEGSVRIAGERVRISVQLIEPVSDTQILVDTYDRRLDDIFAIQDEISAAIVDKLKITLLGELPTVSKMDPAAYVLYLQARELSGRLSRESMDAAAELYRQALEIESDSADIWEGLSTLQLNRTDKGMLPRDEGYRLAREAIERALALDTQNAGAYKNLAVYAESYEGDFVAAAHYYQRALALAPGNARVLGNAAMLLASLGRLENAIALAEHALSRDPVSPIQLGNLGALYYWARRPEDAVATLRTVAAMSPDYFAVRYRIGEALLLAGRPAEAVAEMEAETFEGYRLIGLALARHAQGDRAGSDEALAEAIEKYGAQAAYNIADVHAYRGDLDQAFAYLEQELETSGSGVFREVLVDPLLDNLHADPRWLSLLERLGRSPEQLAAVEFDVVSPGRQ